MIGVVCFAIGSVCVYTGELKCFKLSVDLYLHRSRDLNAGRTIQPKHSREFYIKMSMHFISRMASDTLFRHQLIRLCWMIYIIQLPSHIYSDIQQAFTQGRELTNPDLQIRRKAMKNHLSNKCQENPTIPTCRIKGRNWPDGDKLINENNIENNND